MGTPAGDRRGPATGREEGEPERRIELLTCSVRGRPPPSTYVHRPLPTRDLAANGPKPVLVSSFLDDGRTQGVR